jgi:hypothetical protein
MKLSEAKWKLSQKLQKSKNLFDGYKNGNMDTKCLCDNLSDRILRFVVEELKMLPPTYNYDHRQESFFDVNEWEPEDET